MPFVILTFVGVVVIVLGMYWVLVVRPEQVERAALEIRFAPALKPGTKRQALLTQVQRFGASQGLDLRLAGGGALVASWQRLIEQSGVRTSVGKMLVGSACCAAALFAAGFLVTRSVWVGGALGAVATQAPWVFLRRARRKRVEKFEQLFPEAIDAIARSLRAGHAFSTGLSMVADEIAEPVASEFRLLYDRQNFGMPVPEALRAFADRIPLLDAKFFATAVLTQRESGGNLSEVLDNLGAVIRDRLDVRRQVRIKSAHSRMTGWILVAMPPGLAVVMYFVNPNMMLLLLRDPLGIKMIVGAIALQIIGSVAVSRIVKIDY